MTPHRLPSSVVLSLLLGSVLPCTADVNFRNQVQPVLAKAGCSSGACHGAAAGQNGFRLSLRGYDDAGDFLALTRHALGRRIVPEDPARSLLLLKPSGAVPHKGGKLFEVNSTDYRILADWIAAGTPGPKADDPRIERIEILPAQVVLQMGQEQQLLVRAHFDDGTSSDVTHWAKYNDANASVTHVNEEGLVEVTGHGEGAITAWFLSKVAVATMTVPYTNDVPAAVFADAPRRNFIDDHVLGKLESLNLPPSPRSTDGEFIRRAFLDTLGILPPIEETRAFLADNTPDKRDRLVDSLFEREEFIDYWTHKWADLLLVQSRRLRPAAMWAYHHWIRSQVAANTSWDDFVRRLITARGSTLENGAANFFVLHEDPKTLSETTSQAFLGMSINCAQCHNHPMEKWTNDDYFAMANLFARVRTKNGAADGDHVVFAADRGNLVQPLTGSPQPPRPLDGEPLPLDDTSDRRLHLAEWLTSPGNPYFSRAIVNRVWANFLGVGLVENVDDLRVTNPASNEELLQAAADYLANHDFDLQALMRAILLSETYQRSSEPLPGNATDTRFYSRYYPRRLMAEVLLDACSHVTDAPTTFPNYPEGWRALQLPDANIDSYFLKTFGRPERNVTCECERTDEPSISQVLHIANGDTLNEKLQADANRISRQLKDELPPESILDELWLSALSRAPTDTERERLLALLRETDRADWRPLLEDIYWAVLSSREFLFNH